MIRHGGSHFRKKTFYEQMGGWRWVIGRPRDRFLLFRKVCTRFYRLHLYRPWIWFAYGRRNIKNTFMIKWGPSCLTRNSPHSVGK